MPKSTFHRSKIVVVNSAGVRAMVEVIREIVHDVTDQGSFTHPGQEEFLLNGQNIHPLSETEFRTAHGEIWKKVDG